MDLQPCRYALALAAILLACGCRSEPEPQRVRYSLVATGPEGSPVRMYRSANHLLYTTLGDATRVEAILATLEASHAACVELTGVRPVAGAAPQNAFVFEKRAEWEAFTRARTGAAAPLYLQLDRGGYTIGKACVIRDQGERDTLTVLSHEQLHLFIANNFTARPPPFIEEGLSTLLEDVRVDDGIARINVSRSKSRAARMSLLSDARAIVPLRTLMSMHAGNVVGLSGPEVDAFYAQAWAFVRFLREGEGGRYRPMLATLLSDAATGALSSESLFDNPALVERYLGESLEAIEPAYRRFAASIAD